MRLRRIWWRAVCLAIAAALTACSLGLGMASAEETADDNSCKPDDRNAPRHSECWYDDARELPDTSSPSRIRPDAKAHFGERWGAIWINRDVSPSRLVFGVVRPTDSDRAFIKRLTKDDPRTDVVAVRYGADQLSSWRRQIQPLVERWGDETNAHWRVGVASTSASVYIEENPIDPDLRSEIEALGIPDDAYTLRQGGGGIAAGAARAAGEQGGLGIAVVAICSVLALGAALAIRRRTLRTDQAR